MIPEYPRPVQRQASQKQEQLRQQISAQLLSAAEDGRLEAALARQVWAWPGKGGERRGKGTENWGFQGIFS